MSEHVLTALRRALETAHPRALREVQKEMRTYERTAAGIASLAQPFYRKVSAMVDIVCVTNERIEREASMATVTINRKAKS